MSDFSDYVHICILDELNFKLIEKYNEPYYDKTGKYNGYTLRERDLDKTFFDNIPQEKFVQSQVGKGKNDLIDTNIRSSKIIKDINVRIKSVYELYTDKINIQKGTQPQNTTTPVPEQLNAQELEFLLLLIKQSTFKGEAIEIVFNTALKLQTQYTKQKQ